MKRFKSRSRRSCQVHFHALLGLKSMVSSQSRNGDTVSSLSWFYSIWDENTIFQHSEVSVHRAPQNLSFHFHRQDTHVRKSSIKGANFDLKKSTVITLMTRLIFVTLRIMGIQTLTIKNNKQQLNLRVLHSMD